LQEIIFISIINNGEEGMKLRLRLRLRLRKKRRAQGSGQKIKDKIHKIKVSQGLRDIQ
jgi:hypothetical protein